MEFCSVAEQLKQNLSFVQFVFCCLRARPTLVSLYPRSFCSFRCSPALCCGPHPRYAPTFASGRVPSRQNRLPCFGRRALRPARWSRRCAPCAALSRVGVPVAGAAPAGSLRRSAPTRQRFLKQSLASLAPYSPARPPVALGARAPSLRSDFIFSLYLFALTGLRLTPAPAPSGPPPARSALNRSLFF